MNKPLQFVANGLYDLLSRVGMRGTAAATDLDGKRCRAWDEYGYPAEVSFGQLYTMWRRGGVAHGAVERLIDRCWSEDPELIEGEDTEAKDVTPWEQATKAYADAINLWPVFADADRKRLVGGYSAILLEAPGKWSEPIRRGAVTGVKAVWRDQLKPQEREPVTERVKLWQYTALDGRSLTSIHPDRVFILGNYDDPLSFIEPAYNFLLNLDKVCGGAGEGFLKNAARQLALEFGEGSSLQNLATSMGKSPDEVQDVLNNMARDVNSGIDALFAMVGGKVSPIVAQMPDAGAPFDINLQQAAAAWRIPLKILVGNQTGERASSEDMHDFNSLCQSRNTRQLYPEILAFFQHLVRVKAIPVMPLDATVSGPDLTESSTADKLANAKTMSEINKNGEAGGPIFTSQEIRVAAGQPAVPEDEVAGGPGEADDDPEPEVVTP